MPNETMYLIVSQDDNPFHPAAPTRKVFWSAGAAQAEVKRLNDQDDIGAGPFYRVMEVQVQD